jgi:hypothetical protein
LRKLQDDAKGGGQSELLDEVRSHGPSTLLIEEMEEQPFMSSVEPTEGEPLKRPYHKRRFSSSDKDQKEETAGLDIGTGLAAIDDDAPKFIKTDSDGTELPVIEEVKPKKPRKPRKKKTETTATEKPKRKPRKRKAPPKDSESEL